ncbi:TRADD-N-associated membrane domain-containing protein [Fusobacterium varium]|jgi:hypothetical protein|nr:MAG TPA: hypothetical protein [Caudoviricetes sp.]
MEENSMNELKNLNLELDNLKERLRKKKRIYLMPIIFLSLTLLILVLIFFSSKVTGKDIFVFYQFFLITIIGFFALNREIKEIEEKIIELINKIEYIEFSNINEKIKSEKQFKLHQYELEKYYKQNLSHNQKIFWGGILSIIFGFGTIFFMLWLLLFDGELNNKIEIIIVGGIGGILSNFIGVVYIKMYSETLKVLMKFHKKLVYTHDLHFANYLLSQIENKELKEEILSKAILKIVTRVKDDD